MTDTNEEERLVLEGIYLKNVGYDNNLIKQFLAKDIAEAVKSNYYGSFVGPRGGLTTWISYGMTGKYAINVLQTTYTIRTNLCNQLICALEPEIKKFLLQKCNDPFEYISTTGRMINRNYLKIAYDKVRLDLEVSDNRIGEYFTELENFESNEKWNEDRHILSVVKHLFWIIMLKSLT